MKTCNDMLMIFYLTDSSFTLVFTPFQFADHLHKFFLVSNKDCMTSRASPANRYKHLLFQRRFGRKVIFDLAPYDISWNSVHCRRNLIIISHRRHILKPISVCRVHVMSSIHGLSIDRSWNVTGKSWWHKIVNAREYQWGDIHRYFYIQTLMTQQYEFFSCTRHFNCSQTCSTHQKTTTHY